MSGRYDFWFEQFGLTVDSEYELFVAANEGAKFKYFHVKFVRTVGEWLYIFYNLVHNYYFLFDPASLQKNVSRNVVKLAIRSKFSILSEWVLRAIG